MNLTTRKLAVLVISFCFMLAPVGVFSQETEQEAEPVQEAELVQETEPVQEAAPPKRNIFVDAGYTGLNILTSNIFAHMKSRLEQQSYADINYETIWKNLSRNRWIWEDRDRFTENQIGHPYQGSTYFASARVNGFSFYESMLFPPLGSIMWEVFLEPTPAINDVISTTVGGIPFGEMLHRLFLEFDSSPSVWSRIFAFFISPMSGFNKIYHRPARMTGGGNIYSLSVKLGVEKSFAFFPGHAEEQDAWKYPGAHVNVNVVYGDPFIQQSKTPYEHFELNVGYSTNIKSYHMAVFSDGYIFSYNPVQTDKTFTSMGLSLHFDYYNATNDISDNLDYGNIQFSNSAIGWAVKHKYRFSESSYLEAKAHAAFTFWGNSMYNDVIRHDDADYWIREDATNRNAYGMGESVKLFFTFFHNKAGKLEFTALGNHFFSIPVNRRHSTGSVFFIYSTLIYDFPLGKRMGIGAKGTFWGLFGLYNSAENVKRFLASSSLYVRYAL